MMRNAEMHMGSCSIEVILRAVPRASLCATCVPAGKLDLHLTPLLGLNTFD